MYSKDANNLEFLIDVGNRAIAEGFAKTYATSAIETSGKYIGASARVIKQAVQTLLANTK